MKKWNRQKINQERVQELLEQIAKYKEFIEKALKLLEVMKDHESEECFAKRKKAKEDLINLRETVCLPENRCLKTYRIKMVNAINGIDEYSVYSKVQILGIEAEMKEVYQELCDDEKLVKELKKN